MDNWKTAITLTYPHEAHIVKGYLESEGINSVVEDDLTAQVNNFYSNAIGGVKVLINDVDYDKGIEILKKGGYINTENTAKESGIELVYIDSPADIKKCPFCQSDNIGKKKGLHILPVILYFTFGFFGPMLFIPIYKITYSCFDCEKVWKYRKAKKHTVQQTV